MMFVSCLLNVLAKCYFAGIIIIVYRHLPNRIQGDIILTPAQKAIFDEGGINALLESEAWDKDAFTWDRNILYIKDPNNLGGSCLYAID